MSRLLERLARPPDSAEVVTDESGAHTWGAIRGRAAAGARRLGGALEPTAGAEPRVGLLVRPGADWLAAFLAIVEAGATAVPLSDKYPPSELAWLLDDAGAAAVVASAGYGRLPALDIPVIDSGELTARAAAGRRARVSDDEDVALLIYTSGTTSKPKGVRWSHRALAHQAELLADAWGLDADTRLLHALPLHHVHGISIALLSTVAAGGSARLLSKFDAAEVWEALGGCNTWMAVPTMYQKLLGLSRAAGPSQRRRWGEHARRLRLATSGSAALPAVVAEKWSAIAASIPLERYGMTEIGVGCTNPLPAAERRVGWVGPPLSSFQVRVVDERGAESAHGEPGELWMRGPSLFSGYHRRQQETRTAFGGASTADAFFRTGDVVARDAAGWIRVIGRASIDIIKSGGYKLSALEVEEVLLRHPSVDDAAVVGIADAHWGEKVVAAVVLRPGATLDAEALTEHCRGALASYKLPRAIAAVSQLPKNALGKVEKHLLRAELSTRL